ncbi:MAG: CbiX/SirB N-terminal domain-containing protein [Burkholderiales bacterium]|jgi:sirohydrochlorin cobaltochelatase|nr:CbiX/SirB N-terminal domain-containing protein [Burkholderiales bacterium]
MSRRGVILLAHGARDPRWSEPLESVARRTAALAPGIVLTLAFLDFMTPDLADAAGALVRQGCDDLVVVPAFVGVGGHVRSDLPKLVDAIAAEHPGVSIRVAPALGDEPSVQEAMARIVVAAAEA